MATLPTHKYAATYLEHCRVVMADERITYIKAADGVEKHFAIPYANTNILMLGPGTSITHQAARLLGDEGTCLAFVAGGGTPLYLTSVNEYRPTEYVQSWLQFWYDPSARLAVAKYFQKLRVELIQKAWARLAPEADPSKAIARYNDDVATASSNTSLLTAEGRFAKSLYALLAKAYGAEKFTRKPRSGSSIDDLLDMGNYMAYGQAACALWVLGIPYAFGVNHGTTRRGALVFDLADIVKDALVMPVAFVSAAKGLPENKARAQVLEAFDRDKALERMLNAIIEGAKVGTASLGKISPEPNPPENAAAAPPF